MRSYDGNIFKNNINNFIVWKENFSDINIIAILSCLRNRYNFLHPMLSKPLLRVGTLTLSFHMSVTVRQACFLLNFKQRREPNSVLSKLNHKKACIMQSLEGAINS